MNVSIPADLEALRGATRTFVQRELEPHVEVIDRTGEVPADVVRVMAANGYLGARLPESYGGAGLGLFALCIVLEELARSHRVFTLLATETSGLTPLLIWKHGTEEQKRRYLPPLTSGQLRTAFALTEPGAGSDSAAIQTRATAVAEGWRLDGRKHFINGGDVADFVLVMALTDAERRARGGISAFLLDRGTPGFEISRIDTTIGSGAIKLAELTFDNCVVPDSAMLGSPGQGFAMAMETLAEGRLSVAASCIGAADRLLELSLEHAVGRTTFGKPLSERQAIQWMLADSEVELATARCVTYEALRQVEGGGATGAGPSISKLYCSEMVGRVADRAVQIHGGMGVIRGVSIERFYRDVRHYRIGEGTSEIQRMLIAKEIIGSLSARRR